MSILICPICKNELKDTGGSLVCTSPKAHCFDKAKSGYVNLSPIKSGSGDDRDMVKARSEFLDRGYYLPLAETVANLTEGYDTVADCGCGDGYYSVNIARKCRMLYGFDLSKFACDKAAKRAKEKGVNSFFGVGSIFSLPLADNSVDLIVSIFAPIAEDEFVRVLKDNGKLVIVGAGKRHLYELKQAIYREAYENEGRRDLPSGFEKSEYRNLSYTFNCEGAYLRSLFMMTPYAFKTSREDAAKIDLIPSLEISADFDIFVYEKKAPQKRKDSL